MRKLIALLALGVFFSVAGFAAADSTPTGSTTTTTTAQAPSNGRGPAHWFAGAVTDVGTSTLTLDVLWTGPNDGSFDGQSVTVNVTDHTRIFKGPHHQAIALAAIQDGDLVAVRAFGDPTSLTAARIHDFCNCHWIGGTISSIGASSFQVNVQRTGPYDGVLENATVTLQVNDLTEYMRGPRHARIGFGDLKVGEGVGVVFGASGFFRDPNFDPTTATFTAKRVHLWGARQVPPPSSDASTAAGTSAT
jgi:hypothetical protein